jgi:hypothetical protein
MKLQEEITRILEVMDLDKKEIDEQPSLDDISKKISQTIDTGIKTGKEMINKTIKSAEDLMKFPEKVNNFIDARVIIEERAKELYCSDDMDKKTYPYQAMKDKEDAFCHQAMSAYATDLFGETIANIIGFMNEARGGVRIFFKGSSTIKPYETFSSGYTTDTKNNEIGRKIALTNKNKTLEQYMVLIQKNVNSGNFYDRNGVYQKK